jgi:hypothetical protein
MWRVSFGQPTEMIVWLRGAVAAALVVASTSAWGAAESSSACRSKDQFFLQLLQVLKTSADRPVADIAGLLIHSHRFERDAADPSQEKYQGPVGGSPDSAILLTKNRGTPHDFKIGTSDEHAFPYFTVAELSNCAGAQDVAEDATLKAAMDVFGCAPCGREWHQNPAWVIGNVMILHQRSPDNGLMRLFFVLDRSAFPDPRDLIEVPGELAMPSDAASFDVLASRYRIDSGWREGGFGSTFDRIREFQNPASDTSKTVGISILAEERPPNPGTPGRRIEQVKLRVMTEAAADNADAAFAAISPWLPDLIVGFSAPGTAGNIVDRVRTVSRDAFGRMHLEDSTQTGASSQTTGNIVIRVTHTLLPSETIHDVQLGRRSFVEHLP